MMCEISGTEKDKRLRFQRGFLREARIKPHLQTNSRYPKKQLKRIRIFMSANLFRESRAISPDRLRPKGDFSFHAGKRYTGGRASTRLGRRMPTPVP